MAFFIMLASGFCVCASLALFASIIFCALTISLIAVLILSIFIRKRVEFTNGFIYGNNKELVRF